MAPARPPNPRPEPSGDDLLQWFTDTFGVDIRDMPPDEAVAMATGLASRSHVMPWEQPKQPLELADPPEQALCYTLKVTLDGSKPPIWRRITVPSEVTLDQFHHVLQAAMGWTNSHLHQFTPGHDRHGRSTETILTDWDISEGEEGREETTIRLDGLLTTPGDKLHYWYDFGDDWHHTVVLEKAAPRVGEDASASVVAGRRACPPENIGGIHFYSSLFDAADDSDHPEHEWAAEVMANQQLSREEAAAFDLAEYDDAVRRALTGGEALRRILDDVDAHPVAIRELFDGLSHDAARYVAGFVDAAQTDQPVTIDGDAASSATFVIRTVLDHVGDDGVALTAAGYLKPASVSALMAELDPERKWIGRATTEAQTQPLLGAREIITRLGLLRKYRGRLLPTKVGAKLRHDPVKLWWHVARHLPVERPTEGRDAATFILLRLAAGGEVKASMNLELDTFMATRGWLLSGGSPFATRDAWFHFTRSTRDVLGWAATGRVYNYGEHIHSPEARLLARAAVSMLD